MFLALFARIRAYKDVVKISGAEDIKLRAEDLIDELLDFRGRCCKPIGISWNS
jgi:hypothetical protein